MIKFIHTADLHFGMENYGRIDAKTGIHSRLLDFERALNFCVDKAIEYDIDFFLFAGDAYKTATPTPTHQRLLTNCFIRLYKAGIPIVMVVGNHDNPLSFGKAHALDIFGQIPVDGFHVISKPTSFILSTKSGPVQIVGIPWPTRNTIALNSGVHTQGSDLTNYISSGVCSIISQLAAQLSPDLPSVLMGHLTVSNGIFSGSEKRAIYGTDPLFMPSQLAIQPFDYVALGHLHRYQNLNPNGYPAIVYSGSVERIDFGERKEEKGFCLVTIHEKNQTTHEFIKTPIRPFIQLDIYLDPERSATETILAEIIKHDIDNAILKIVYFIPEGKKDRVDVTAIQQACAHAWHLVGIIPVKLGQNRERRTSLKVDMTLPALLTAYFDSKEVPKEAQAKLIEKTLQLEHEIEQFENQ